MTAKIKSIQPARKVDDDLREDQSTFTRDYHVITDGPEPITVFDVIDFDYRFRPGYRFSDIWKVNNAKLRETEDDQIYTLEIEFVTIDFKTPYQALIEWEWESTTLDLPAYTDAKGRPLVNTAGELLTGLTRPLKLWILRGTRNVPGVPKWFRDYGVSMNSDATKIDGETFAPKTLQLQRLRLGTYESIFVNRTEYRFRPLTYEFFFNPLTWTTQALNLGLTELVVFRRETVISGVPNFEYQQIRATDSKGLETPGRVFLNETGQRPRDDFGRVKVRLQPDDIYVLKFDLLEELSYNFILK